MRAKCSSSARVGVLDLRGKVTTPIGYCSARCSSTIRRTSSMVSGWSWQECAELTTSSDSTPSMCALLYSTTPSSPSGFGPPPFTAMIEWPTAGGTIGSLLRPAPRIGASLFGANDCRFRKQREQVRQGGLDVGLVLRLERELHRVLGIAELRVG